MTLATPLTLLGAPGSPYTRKMLGVLRYRHIPYRLILQGSPEHLKRPQPKVPLLPTFYLPDDTGQEVAVTDSTPLIRRFEAEFPERRLLPADPVLNFLDALLEDLESRGLLERTVVLWMGEFGRTPKINARGGRDHFPRAFSAVMAGGGIRGGQVIGKTNKDGTEVADNPVVVPDLLTSMMTAFEIDPNKKYYAGQRPMQLGKKGAKIVPGLFA